MNAREHNPIVVGVTSDLVAADGRLTFPDYPLADLARHGVSIKRIDVTRGHQAADLADLDLLISVPHGAPIDAAAFEGADRLTAIVRVGVGYEDCDTTALTHGSVALVIPTDATQRPTAVAALTLILALATRLMDKHRLTLEGSHAWDQRSQIRGRDLKGKVLGLVGCGAIGRHLIEISRSLELSFVIHDPAFDSDAAGAVGAQLLPLDELLSQADFVSIHCPLTRETHRLINADRLGRMKQSAYLINTARGGIVDQHALAAALRNGRIAGAGLDVFESEPPADDDPILRLENVVLSAHALNWTQELDADLGRSNSEAIGTMLTGGVPDGIVNRAVIDDRRFREKLANLARRRGTKIDTYTRESGALR